jgi:dienelactone hydrolase
MYSKQYINKIALTALFVLVFHIYTYPEINNPDENQISGDYKFELPAGTKVYYINILDSAGNISSTNPVIQGETNVPAGKNKRIVFNKDVWKAPEVYRNAPDSLAYPGMEALYYEGLPYEGKKTKVFAYIGYPSNIPKGTKVPAVVLVHGGAGTAFPQWVKIWNDKGYAAIAMDLESRQPIVPGDYKSYGNNNGPSNNHYQDINKKIENQWMYHAVADVYLAYSLLAADERVDSKKIGITGISWGGIITSIAIGNADCFAFAVPVYGCGYMYESKGAMKKDYSEKVAGQWDYSNWTGYVNTPTLWINSDSDFSFSLDATAKTVKNTKNSMVTILPSYPHSHADGWNPAEIYTFANSVVKNEPGLIKITKQPGIKDFSFNISAGNSFGIKSAELIYSKEQINYNSENKLTNTWNRVFLELKNTDKP